jgi:hypothetical protein
MPNSTILDNHQLSREKPGPVKWLLTTPLPPFVVYLREVLWTEEFAPCVRSMFRAEAICHTVCRDTGRALRLFVSAHHRQGQVLERRRDSRRRRRARRVVLASAR